MHYNVLMASVKVITESFNLSIQDNKWHKHTEKNHCSLIVHIKKYFAETFTLQILKCIVERLHFNDIHSVQKMPRILI